MGLIKYKGETIYSGPLVEVNFNSNWCDSMAEYYPRLWVSWLEINELKSKEIDVPQESYQDWETRSEIYLDQPMVDILLQQRNEEKRRKEELRLDYHKLVRVIKGRKLPIGTEGEIFWMGTTKYGPAIGLRLLDGSKVFTSPSNVKVVTIEELLERDLLGKDVS